MSANRWPKKRYAVTMRYSRPDMPARVSAVGAPVPAGSWLVGVVVMRAMGDLDLGGAIVAEWLRRRAAVWLAAA